MKQAEKEGVGTMDLAYALSDEEDSFFRSKTFV
jgi:hypothetical protein